jgi:hypothetical protein
MILKLGCFPLSAPGALAAGFVGREALKLLVAASRLEAVLSIFIFPSRVINTRLADSLFVFAKSALTLVATFFVLLHDSAARAELFRHWTTLCGEEGRCCLVGEERHF